MTPVQEESMMMAIIAQQLTNVPDDILRMRLIDMANDHTIIRGGPDVIFQELGSAFREYQNRTGEVIYMASNASEFADQSQILLNDAMEESRRMREGEDDDIKNMIDGILSARRNNH